MGGIFFGDRRCDVPPPESACKCSRRSSDYCKAKFLGTILYDLAYNAPNVLIDLKGEPPGPSVRMLARARILKVIGKTTADLLGPPGRLRILLTNRGQRIAERWPRVAGQRRKW